MTTEIHNEHESTPVRPVEGDGHYVWGLPAFLVGAVGVCVILYSDQYADSKELFERYLHESHEAVTSETYQAADVYYRKLSFLKPDDPAIQYGLGRMAEEQGNLRRAVNLMQRIAPADYAGFDEAHFWLARYMVEKNRVTREELLELRHHVEQTLAAQPHNAYAHAYMALVLIEMKAHKLAAEHLQNAAEELPQWRVPLARLHSRNGNTEQAKYHARAAIEHYRREVERDPSNSAARLKWAEALLFLRDFDGVERILAEGQEYFDDESIRLSLVSFYCGWWDVLKNTGFRNRTERRLELLQRAMQYAPNHPAVIGRLTRLSLDTGPDADTARETIQTLLTTGQAPGTAHLILGTHAISVEDFDKAILHTEQAVRLLPESYYAVNNLAWLYARSREPGKLQQALELANRAVELNSGNGNIRDTRGQILAKLGHWHDALADLEIALRGMANDVELRQTLAHVYEQLGQTDVAELHRQKAKELLSNESVEASTD